MASAKGRAKGVTDPPRCEGTKKDGSRCTFKARPGTAWCTRHTPSRVHPLDRVVGNRGEKEITAAQLMAEAVRAGASLAAAYKSAGISRSSFFEYRARGEEWIGAEEAGEPIPADVSRFMDFAESLKKAEGDCVTAAVAIINQAAQGRGPRIKDGVVVDAGEKPQWMAAAWIAERREPSEYARPTRTELTGKDGGPIKTEAAADLSRLSIEDREKLLELQEKMRPKETP